MTVYVLKMIAMSTMLVDHIAFWFVDNNNMMRNIGRLAFIIVSGKYFTSVFRLPILIR